jgi:hypothetical protein
MQNCKIAVDSDFRSTFVCILMATRRWGIQLHEINSNCTLKSNFLCLRGMLWVICGRSIFLALPNHFSLIMMMAIRADAHFNESNLIRIHSLEMVNRFKETEYSFKCYQ